MVDEKFWGYNAQPIQVTEIVEKLKDEVSQGIDKYDILPEGPEECQNQFGYKRISVSIPVSETLYDQFFNGRSGYRAQYYHGIENGESFNRLLIDTLAPLIVKAEYLYKDTFTRELCEQSLCGKYSKFWFSKEITDPSGQAYLDGLPEVILADRWKKHWKHKDKPRKGLLAPKPENKIILLNGTFINLQTGDDYEQKPGRSKELYETGWT